MKEWIISIVCMAVLGVLLDLLISEGETKKYVKGIMSVIIIAVVIAPLPKLLKKDFDIDSVFQSAADARIETDGAYLYSLYSAQYAEKSRRIESALKNSGIEAEVAVNFSCGQGAVRLDNVVVSMQNSVISKNGQNINIIETVNGAVMSVLDIPAERIIVYGTGI